LSSFDQLLTFVRIVEARSISGAARTLGITSSGVSRNLNRLEDHLQARLFDRSTRALHLTPEGSVFYGAALRALQSLDEAESSVASMRAGATGTLRVHCIPTFARNHLAPRLPAFLERNPDLRLELELTNDRVDLVREGVDIAITLGPMPDSSYVVKPITRCRWLICASPDYLRKHGTPRTAADLRLHNCLGFTMHNTTWNEWSIGDSEDPTRVAVRGNVATNSGDLIRDLVLAGVGLGRLGEPHVWADIASGALVEIMPDSHSNDYETLQAIYPHRRHLSERVTRFLDFLEEEFGDRELWETLALAAPAARRVPAKLSRV
jgi:DNA-binding transcriptional LysR family regulator